MLLVQKYHSVHDIDPEFVASIEVLLQEEVPNFSSLKDFHDLAPATDAFTYFLFFGPTQNTPIGYAQLCLRKIPHLEIYPWWKRILFFWNRDYENWQELIWKSLDGAAGLYVFDPKYARTGKEKFQEIVREYGQRKEVEAQLTLALRGVQEFEHAWKQLEAGTREVHVLEPLAKSVKSYEAYLNDLAFQIQKQIKASWKQLHQQKNLTLGDYAVAEVGKRLRFSDKELETLQKRDAQVLTFERDDEILGCLVILKGKNGNVFVEPHPYEPHEASVVSDELYIQYAILKFFELADARKCHLLRLGRKIFFEDREDLTFFQDQGFSTRILVETFYSRLPKLRLPV